MRKRIIECDTCAKQHDLKQALSPEWLVVRRYGDLIQTGNTVSTPVYSGKELVTTFREPEWIFTGKEEQHFCSEDCLRAYFQVSAQSAPEPQEQLACKARRF